MFIYLKIGFKILTLIEEPPESPVSFDKYTKPIIEPFKKQTHFCVGFTGASKSTTVETIAEKLLNAGQTGFDAYGGEFHENA